MTDLRMQRFSLNGSSHKPKWPKIALGIVAVVVVAGVVFGVEERAAYHRRQLEEIKAASGERRDEAILGLLRSILSDLEHLKQLAERSDQ